MTKRELKKRVKNSQTLSNVKKVDESGYIELKSSGYARIMKFKAIDLSLLSSQERETFYKSLKDVFKIKNLMLKCYKLDEQLNLNRNKTILEREITKCENEVRKSMLQEQLSLLYDMEAKGLTITSNYYWVLISDSMDHLNMILNDVVSTLDNVTPKLSFEFIQNKLEVYKILSNLYLSDNDTLDDLLWYDLPDLLCPRVAIEKSNYLKFDDKEVQMISLKKIPHVFEQEQFLEAIFNLNNVRCCLSIKDVISQEDLIKYVDSQYKYLLMDINSSKKLSDATELEIQKEKQQALMQNIKTGDETLKEVTLILVISGSKKEREETLRELKQIATKQNIKLEISLFRQIESWQAYDISFKTLEDYATYLPTTTICASFPFTKSNFNDYSGFMLGIDLHSLLPVFFDPYSLSSLRTSHNIAVVGMTGSGKTFLDKKIILNEFALGTKIFVFDTDEEYKNLITKNGGEYIDIFNRENGIINPLQIRYLQSDADDDIIKETDCPLVKHLSFLEAFFKASLNEITEKEMIVLIDVIEKLYNKFNIFKNTSINTLESLSVKDYPIITDLYNYLSEYKITVSAEKQKIVDQLEILLSRFLSGSDSYLFNDYTNIDFSNDLIAFNLQDLFYSNNQRLKNAQLINLLTYLNNTITTLSINNNKLSTQKRYMLIFEEAHFYIDKENLEILKLIEQHTRRGRKRGGSVIFSTQSVQDFVGNDDILRHSRVIFNNCQYVFTGMLKDDDLNAYLEIFKENSLTETQREFLAKVEQGQFLLNVDNKTRLKIKVFATGLELEKM